jgi:hypothetical protein
MDFREQAENFVRPIQEAVLLQFPGLHFFSEYPGYFIFRRGDRIVQMLVRADDTVTLTLIFREESPSTQTFPYVADANAPIAATIIEWFDFGRNLKRGT